MKKPNILQVTGAVIAIIAGVFAYYNEDDTLDTIAGVVSALGVTMLIMRKENFRKKTS